MEKLLKGIIEEINDLDTYRAEPWIGCLVEREFVKEIIKEHFEKYMEEENR